MRTLPHLLTRFLIIINLLTFKYKIYLRVLSLRNVLLGRKTSILSTRRS